MNDDLAFGISQLNGALMNATNLVSVSQSKKADRAFMREMYERQLADNIMLWTMQNQYNSPSAQRERLRDANLNENLVYGSGGVVGTTNLPSSAHYSGGYSTPPEVKDLGLLSQYLQLRQYQKNLELTDAQISKIGAEANSIEANTRGRNLENQFYADTMQVRMDLLHGNLSNITASTNKLAQDMINSVRITDEQVQTMAQARLYEIKRYNLSAQEVGARIKQGWAQVANGAVQASAAMQNAATNALRVAKSNQLTDEQIGKMAIEKLNLQSQGRGYYFDNYRKALELDLKMKGVGLGSHVYDNVFGPFIGVGEGLQHNHSDPMAVPLAPGSGIR